MSASAVIVAGGQSSRLGRDKRRLKLWGDDGPMLLEHTVATAAALCDEVVVVLNDPDEWRRLPALLVTDRYPGSGPLGGIASGLAAISHDAALTLAADLPLLNQELLRAMLERPRDYDALIPRREGTEGSPRNSRNLETLHAIYSTSCLAPIEQCLADNNRRIIAFLDHVRVTELEPADWQRFDPHGHSFMNINTPEQLATIQDLLHK